MRIEVKISMMISNEREYNPYDMTWNIIITYLQLKLHCYIKPMAMVKDYNEWFRLLNIVKVSCSVRNDF